MSMFGRCRSCAEWAKTVTVMQTQMADQQDDHRKAERAWAEERMELVKKLEEAWQAPFKRAQKQPQAPSKGQRIHVFPVSPNLEPPAPEIPPTVQEKDIVKGLENVEIVQYA